MRHVRRVTSFAQKMIGAGKRDETLGMVGGSKDVIGILDIHRVVDWRVENEQRFLQPLEVIFQILLFDILKKCPANPKVPAGQCYFDVIFIANLRDLFSEQANHMRGIERRTDGHNGSRFVDRAGGGEHGSDAETVADQERRRRERQPQMIGRRDQIFDVRGERRIGELSLAGAKPGEIEAQYADATDLQSLRDTPRSSVALAAGEAMRKESHRAHGAVRSVEQRGELLARGIWKIESFGWHRSFPCEASKNYW